MEDNAPYSNSHDRDPVYLGSQSESISTRGLTHKGSGRGPPLAACSADQPSLYSHVHVGCKVVVSVSCWRFGSRLRWLHQKGLALATPVCHEYLRSAGTKTRDDKMVLPTQASSSPSSPPARRLFPSCYGGIGCPVLVGAYIHRWLPCMKRPLTFFSMVYPRSTCTEPDFPENYIPSGETRRGIPLVEDPSRDPSLIISH